jgi:hypothetical protein
MIVAIYLVIGWTPCFKENLVIARKVIKTMLLYMDEMDDRKE